MLVRHVIIVSNPCCVCLTTVRYGSLVKLWFQVLHRVHNVRLTKTRASGVLFWHKLEMYDYIQRSAYSQARALEYHSAAYEDGSVLVVVRF